MSATLRPQFIGRGSIGSVPTRQAAFTRRGLRLKAAVRAYVEDALRIPGFNIRWQSQGVQLSADGSLAYMFGTNTVTVSGHDGAPAATDGRGLSIWRREDDGIWRCSVEIWNTDHPASLS
ncbi:YybH family protein [Luteitalea pratensis]|uniref:YybH family protein n=1 Tax=Luteitalea pratensis TaxID=1855912 RepID=UPI003AAB3970